jgi:hypothetical protein
MKTLLLLAAFVLTGCKVDPYNVTSRADGTGVPQQEAGFPDVQGFDAGADQATDGGYKDTHCVKSGVEVCDGLDNDCNAKVDDVDPTMLVADAKNCGKCGNACSFANGFGKCVDSKCVLDSCAPGYWNVNKDAADGCEYHCLATNGGVEICDNVDNDCDGTVDNGFDKTKDVSNCGSCGTVCSTSHTTSSCVNGVCKLAPCDAGWSDINKDPADGCEYKCPIWPPATTDPCDGIDNNCNGKVDEDFVPASPCYTAGSGCDVATGVCKGECKMGVASCTGGLLTCANEVGPKSEICDNKDNDCDGVVDNGYDKQNDPRYCGGCTACTVPHAIAKCVQGVCGLAVCELGWVDLDNNPATGCEYKCTVTGVEICDGLDNDCNGKTDAADPGMLPLGGNPCLTLGACAGATVGSCQGANGWVCNYGPDVELKKCTSNTECGTAQCVGGVCQGVVAADETRCDGKDNNCNGLVDESFTDKGKPCVESGKQGICQGTGTYTCNSGGTATLCTITTPGQAAKDEQCNGLDDDCDGLVDEEADDAAGKGVVDTMVHIARTYNATAYDFYIYTYEASRPDADASKAGALTSRACSKSNVLPWANVTFTQATAACVAAGKRLCTATEWFLACSGAPADPTGCTTTSGDGCYYPYADTYAGATCNGKDFNATQDAVVPVGSAASCKSPDGVYDMSGNLKEWTNDPRSDGTPPDPDGYTVRGGAHDTPYPGLRCDFTFAVAPPSFSFPNLGFRCCSNTAP